MAAGIVGSSEAAGRCTSRSTTPILPRRGRIDAIDVYALDRALSRLEALDPQQGRVVELRFFGGLTIEETAVVMGLSPATIKREWAVARAWLYRELTGEGGRLARQGGTASAQWGVSCNSRGLCYPDVALVGRCSGVAEGAAHVGRLSFVGAQVTKPLGTRPRRPARS